MQAACCGVRQRLTPVRSSSSSSSMSLEEQQGQEPLVCSQAVPPSTPTAKARGVGVRETRASPPLLAASYEACALCLDPACRLPSC